MDGRKRTVQIKFRVTEAERDLILEKMKLVPTRNMAAYLRKIAIDGYIIQIDHADIKAMTAEIQKIGVNVNQIARRVNATGNAYKEDIEEIKGVLAEIWRLHSFQYIEDAVFENCDFDTKDAFWHAKNVTVRNSTVKGEYLAWYCENVTFENCKIIGTQPLCYCKGLKLIDCEMIDTDLSFEKSEVEAVITTPVMSIKNPLAGHIYVPAVGEIIQDDVASKGEIVVERKCHCA
ncbi:DUF3737 family protein [bacterium 0.1xD8-71]|nr:DUF3737 family protein [bacterium 0.1xD8-71]